MGSTYTAEKYMQCISNYATTEGLGCQDLSSSLPGWVSRYNVNSREIMLIFKTTPEPPSQGCALNDCNPREGETTIVKYVDDPTIIV